MSLYSEDELFEVFLNWINLFELSPHPIRSVFELNDGVVIAKLLSRLSPNYFRLKDINQFPSNQLAKNNNIIELKRCLEQFFNDVIDQDIAVDKMIDHNKITSHSYSKNDSVRLRHFTRLLEMILLCSIKCQNKQETIGKMTSLTMDDQRKLMMIIQALMTNSGFDIKSNENTDDANEKIQTPQKTSFRRLSLAKYSNQSRRKSILSPFGSKRKKRFNMEMSPTGN